MLKKKYLYFFRRACNFGQDSQWMSHWEDDSWVSPEVNKGEGMWPLGENVKCRWLEVGVCSHWLDPTTNSWREAREKVIQNMVRGGVRLELCHFREFGCYSEWLHISSWRFCLFLWLHNTLLYIIPGFFLPTSLLCGHSDGFQYLAITSNVEGILSG